jgi:hypothetical protein
MSAENGFAVLFWLRQLLKKSATLIRDTHSKRKLTIRPAIYAESCQSSTIAGEKKLFHSPTLLTSDLSG